MRVCQMCSGDGDLSVEELKNKWTEKGWTGHPCYTVGYWQELVYSGETLTGYWEWVSEQLKREVEHG